MTYQKLLRQCRIGSYIFLHIAQTLSGNSFRHISDFAINDFDFSLFGLSNENKYDVQYSLNDFKTLDDIFFRKSGMYVTKQRTLQQIFFLFARIRFKAESRRIVVTMQKAICIHPFDINYRAHAVEYFTSVTTAIVNELEHVVELPYISQAIVE